MDSISKKPEPTSLLTIQGFAQAFQTEIKRAVESLDRARTIAEMASGAILAMVERALGCKR